MRKTNLFYKPITNCKVEVTTEGDKLITEAMPANAHFLTFSNYTEAMTGNHLSVNTKLFPSKFLCCYIEQLDPNYENTEGVEEISEDAYDDEISQYGEKVATTIIAQAEELKIETPDTSKIKEQWKQIGILHKKLIAYYENKLAFLRDQIGKDEKQMVEESIQPLNYLLNILADQYGNLPITYVGEISEQNYNGTYADTICIIEGSAKPHTVEYTENESGSEELIRYGYYDKEEEAVVDYPVDYLYGWFHDDEYDGPAQYEKYKPQFDTDQQVYYIKNNFNGIKYTEVEPVTADDVAAFNSDGERSPEEINEYVKSHSRITFNCVIPLFDIVNVDVLTNRSVIVEDGKLSFENPDGAIINQPMGIWFSPDFKPIVLERDDTTGYMPSWSLVLGSQFKPFPASKLLAMDENETDHTVEIHNTFAEILAKQTNVLDSFMNVTAQISDIRNDVVMLESKMNNIASQSMIDDLTVRINSLETLINNLTQKFNEAIDNLTWHNK